MSKSIIAVALAILFPLQVFAAQLPLQTRANTTSPSVDTNFSRQQLMNTEVYTTKADKDKVVRVWADFPDGGDAISVGTPVWYDGKLYNTIQAFVKTAGATPDTFTAYFEVASGNGGTNDYNDLVNTPTIPTALADLTTDSTHRVVTDAEKTAWNAKQSALVAGTDYVSPSGSVASATVVSTGFNGNLATTDNTLQEIAQKFDDFAGGSDDQTAAEVPVVDSGEYYTATNVESILAEIGAYQTIAFDPATLTTTTVGTTDTISVKVNTFHAYDANMITWPSTITATEVGYLDGLTEAISTSLSNKQATIVQSTDCSTYTASGQLCVQY